MQRTETVARPGALRTLCLLTAAIVSSGCGNLTMGGFGDATVVVSGDAPDAAAALAAAPTQATPTPGGSLPGGLLPTSGEEQPEGEVQVTFMLYLVAESGAELQLGEEIEVRVDLQGVSEADVVREAVPADTYTELRIVFLDIKAEVDAGLVIGGVPVTGEVRVEFDDITLPVSKPIDLEVIAGGAVEIVIDLNAPAWLQAVDPVAATVDAQVFADLVAAVTR